MVESKLISIVIPTYNPNMDYLNELFTEICKINKEKCEVLLIDDGSDSDISEKIKKLVLSFEFRYEKVLINSGVSNARNFGISKSIGQYLLFVDSDDIIDGNLLDAFISQTELTADVYVFGSANLNSKTNNLVDYDFEMLDVDLQKFYLDPYYKKLYFSPRSACAKLFKKSIIEKNGIQFDKNLRFSEDCLFNICYMQNALSIKLISGSDLYFVRENLKSASRTFSKKYADYYNLYFDKAISATNNKFILFFIYRDTISIIAKVRICMSFKKFKIRSGLKFIKSNAVIISAQELSTLIKDPNYKINIESLRFIELINKRRFLRAYFYIVKNRILSKFKKQN